MRIIWEGKYNNLNLRVLPLVLPSRARFIRHLVVSLRRELGVPLLRHQFIKYMLIIKLFATMKEINYE
jgi:hypothetical protein